MNAKLNILVCWIFSILLSISNASKHNEDQFDFLLSRLEAAEDVIQQLSGRVEAQQQVILDQLNRIEHLERRESVQQQLNMDLQRQLALQRQRTSSLERFSERMKMIVRPYVNKQTGNKDSVVKQILSNSGINVAFETENSTQDFVVSPKGKFSTTRLHLYSVQGYKEII
jgi:ABC-type phosphate transport system auxiliary subunit